MQSIPQGLEYSAPDRAATSARGSTWISYLLCAALVSALVVGNYIW